MIRPAPPAHPASPGPARRPARLLPAAALAAAALAGCAPTPRVDFDLRLLDAVPVVPIQTDTGTCTALLMDDGSLLTCSHGVPRGRPSGDLCILGLWTTYTVLESGDGLAHEWSTWSDGVAAGTHKDWSHLRTVPAAPASAIFSPLLPVTLSTTPPTPGETVYIVGYTVEPDPPAPDGLLVEPREEIHRLVRHWTPMVVIDPPTRRFAATAEPVFWMETSAGRYLDNPRGPGDHGGRPSAFTARGYSGAPVLRRTATGFEACGILVCGDRSKDDPHGRFALAIPVPTLAR